MASTQTMTKTKSVSKVVVAVSLIAVAGLAAAAGAVSLKALKQQSPAGAIVGNYIPGYVPGYVPGYSVPGYQAQMTQPVSEKFFIKVKKLFKK